MHTRFLRWASSGLIALTLLLSLAVVAPAPVDAYVNTSTESVCLNTEERAFLKLINDYRASRGLPALKASRSMSAASYTHSLDMGRRAYFAHDTKLPLPAGQSGAKFYHRMADAGYTYNTYKGENIAAGYASAQQVFNAWKSSSGHNANMLNANFKSIGIGRAVVSGSQYGTYWTTDFGGVVDAAPTC
jgi:uncharacterized protein YkwD